MTSLFDPGSSNLPPNLLSSDLIAQCRRGVSLLEFVSFDEPEPVVQQQPAPAEPEFVIDERALQTAAMIDAARSEAALETRALCTAEAHLREAELQARIERLTAEFAIDRSRYFAAAEAQIVRLALAVARRVLAREAEADPMHLTATVRAALARVQDGSRTVLRVNSFEAEAWRTLFTGETVDVIGEERIASGECILETSVGRVELGIRPQMEEIEHGFEELTERHRG